MSSAGRQLAHLRHQLDHLDTMLGKQRPRAESCLAGRAKGCGAYRDGTSAWYPAGRVVYDAEDWSLYDNMVRTVLSWCLWLVLRVVNVVEVV